VSRNSRRAGFFAIVAGIVFFVISIQDLLSGLQSERWPVTEGTIQSAAINRHVAGRGGHTYDVDISYSYQINGQNFLGNQLAFGDIDWFSSQNQTILARYPVGKKIQVHYSPNNPQLAVLEAGIVGETWLCLGVGAFFILAGTIMLLKCR
jgi:hypothetical protein